MQIPLTQIDETALPRDRSVLDEGALTELQTSIAVNGLRQPIEVFATDTGYGLISGYRRLAAVQALYKLTNDEKYATISATLRTPADHAAALHAMVEENDIRADISPWDQARVAVSAVPHAFETIDAAIHTLYRNAARQRRARIRTIADVVENYAHLLTAPETLSMRRLERLAAATRSGFDRLIEHALTQTKTQSVQGQWAILDNVLREAEAEARSSEPEDPRPGRPRRNMQPRADLHIRREMTRDGWSLRFTGREATGPFMEEIMDYIEQNFGRE